MLTHPGLANGALEWIFGASREILRIPVAVRKRDFNSGEEGIEGDPFRVSVDSTQPPFC